MAETLRVGGRRRRAPARRRLPAPTPTLPGSCTSPTGSRSRCWSRDPRAWARPSWPRPSPPPPAPASSACSATRASTRPRPSTSGTTRSSCCASRPTGSTRPSWDDVEADIFSEPFLLTRPLLEAIRAEEPVVLLIDEVDRVEIETEALLLEVLSDFQVSIPELGTIVGAPAPDRGPHVEQHPRAVGGAEAPVPVPAHRLPRHRPREGDRAGAGARDRRRARRADRARRALDPRARPEEGALDLGDDRLGPHAHLPRPVGDLARGHRRHAARAAEVPVRHREGPQGTRRQRVADPAKR